jgi:putative nucleotidyltransferase with HDIG domain
MNTQLDISSEESNTYKILIIDDEETIRNLFDQALTNIGYECVTAENGKLGVEKVKSDDNFDVVLLDVHMPVLNGIETLKQIIQHDPDISIIMVSASIDIEHVRVALKEGAYDYLFKPFNVVEVEAVIKRSIERSKLIKQNRDYQRNLEIKVKKQTMELVKLYAGTLEAMVLALDLREKETGYHSYRVTEYALTLAKKMELSENELSIIAKGALLHDIGKIGVPDNILLKPGKLTDEEWEIMKKHPRHGYELLRNIDFLEESALIVLHHHEYFNGKGYPVGLVGDQIPLGARIFSIVDTMDALTSKRVYKDASSFEESFERISEASESQFDPWIVEAFMDISIDQYKEIRNKVESSGSDYLRSLLYELSNY